MHLGDVAAAFGFAWFLNMRETDRSGTDIASRASTLKSFLL